MVQNMTMKSMWARGYYYLEDYYYTMQYQIVQTNSTKLKPLQMVVWFLVLLTCKHSTVLANFKFYHAGRQEIKDLLLVA